MAALRFFLTARHCQLFVPFIGAILFLELIGLDAATEASHSPVPTWQVLLPFLLLTVFFMLFFLAWLWTLGEFLWPSAPRELRPSISRFRFSILYPLVYLPVSLLFVMTSDPESGWLVIVFPFHLLAT